MVAIIERELRVALRKGRPVRARCLAAGLFGVVALLFLLLAAVTGDRQTGQELHRLFCLAALVFLLRTPLLTAGLLARERKNQTLGFLFLSGLGAGEVFLSKLCSGVMIAMTELLAIAPVLGVSFVLGGVSSELFLATVCALPNWLMFMVAVSLLASVLTENDGAAVALSGLLALVICLAGPAVYRAHTYLAAGAKAGAWWLWISPAYGPFLLWGGFRRAAPIEFWRCFVLTAAWSVLLLGAAAVALKRIWRERQEPSAESGWRRRWQRLVQGSRQYRQQLAARWLAGNPFTWLAARDRQPAALAWAVVGGTVVLWFCGWGLWPRQWPSAASFLATAALVNFSLRWIMNYTAARSLSEGRHDGAYELLLTTPLEPNEMVWGEFEALRELFQPVTRAVLALDGLMLIAGLLVRSWNVRALIEYGLVWVPLILWSRNQSSKWRQAVLAMWAGLNSARPAHAVWRLAAGGGPSWTRWWWIFVIWVAGRNLSIRFQQFPTGSIGEVCFVSGCVLLAFLVLVVGSFGTEEDQFEFRLVSEFREIVREPLPDPHDRRFRRWNIRRRFPWGWEMAEEQLHERAARRAEKLALDRSVR